jgi:hypothetical protein
LIAITTVAASCAGMVALHLFRGDISPLRTVMSHYANGSGGVVMSLVFYAFGATAVALGVRLRTGMVPAGVTRLLSPLLVLGGACLVAAGVFEVDRPEVASTVADYVHSDAAVAGFGLVIASMWVLAIGCRREQRWWTFRRVALGLAAIATVGAVANRLLTELHWDGAVQRTLGGAVLLWELLVALRVRRTGFEAS